MIFDLGDTGGNRQTRVLGSAANLKKKVLLEGKIVEHQDDLELKYSMACLFSHVWNEAKKVLPDQVVRDFDEATARLGDMGMGSVLWGGDRALRYALKLGSREEYVETESLAPCGGIGAVNYGRYVLT